MTQRYNVLYTGAAIPVSLAIVFSFLYLGSESIWLDEAYSIAHANLDWSALTSLIIQLETNMSLYYFLLKAWIFLFGDSEIAVRALSAVFLPATVAVTFAIAKKLFDTRVAFFSGMLLATHAFGNYYAQEGRSYSMLLFLATTSVYLLIIAIERNEIKYYVWLGLVNAIMMYTHLYGAFILLLQFATIIMAPRHNRHWKRCFISWLIPATLSLPLIYLVLTARGNPWSWAAPSNLLSIVFAVKELTGGAIVLSALSAMSILFALIVAAKRIKTSGDWNLVWNYLLLVLWAGIPIICLYVISRFGPAFENRYLITTLPAVVILTALGIAGLNRKHAQMFAFGLLVSLSTVNLASQYASMSKQDWRTATRAVLEGSESGDAIMFYGWMAKYPFEYYVRQFEANGFERGRLTCVWPAPLLDSDHDRTVATFIHLVTDYNDPTSATFDGFVSDHSRLWVVYAMENIKGMGFDRDTFVATIESYYEATDEIAFDQIRIVKYDRVSARVF